MTASPQVARRSLNLVQFPPKTRIGSAGIQSRFRFELTRSAEEDLSFFSKSERRFILQAVEVLLAFEPSLPSRNRKQLRPNELARWELRVGNFRVFYDVEEEERMVMVRGVGWKDRHRLLLRGKEFQL
jgi:mRNA-degrading endonuclease RelE of RelBE toxin-antitoxin system